MGGYASFQSCPIKNGLAFCMLPSLLGRPGADLPQAARRTGYPRAPKTKVPRMPNRKFTNAVDALRPNCVVGLCDSQDDQRLEGLRTGVDDFMREGQKEGVKRRVSARITRDKDLAIRQRARSIRQRPTENITRSAYYAHRLLTGIDSIFERPRFG